MKRNKKGQTEAIYGVLVGAVFIATILVLLVLIIYTFGTVHESLEDRAVSNSVTGESAFANLTTFTVAGTSSTGEPRTFTLVQAHNITAGVVDITSNVTLSSTGVLQNSTTVQYPDVNVSYSYLNNSAEQTASRDAQTNTTRALPIVGILLIILAVAALITILMVSLTGRRRS